MVVAVPGPPKHVKSWPLWLLLWVDGYYFTYFWGLGNNCSTSNSNSKSTVVE